MGEKTNETNQNAPSAGDNGGDNGNGPVDSTDPSQSDAGTEAGQEHGQTGSETHSEGQGGNSEAAKYRRQLRDTEGERDTLRSQLQAMQAREVERLAGSQALLRDGSDVWHGGTDIAGLVNDDGTVSEEAVKARVHEIGQEKPHFMQKWDNGQGPRGTKPTKQPAFQDLLQNGS